MYKITVRYVQNICQVCTKHQLGMYKTFVRYVQNISQVCTKHVRYVQNICLGMYKISVTYVQNYSQVDPAIFWKGKLLRFLCYICNLAFIFAQLGNSYTAQSGNSYAAQLGNSYTAQLGNSYTAQLGNSYTAQIGNSYTAQLGNSYTAQVIHIVLSQVIHILLSQVIHILLRGSDPWGMLPPIIVNAFRTSVFRTHLIFSIFDFCLISFLLFQAVVVWKTLASNDGAIYSSFFWDQIYFGWEVKLNLTLK